MKFSIKKLLALILIFTFLTGLIPAWKCEPGGGI